MENSINVEVGDFRKILHTAEILVNEVEQVFQDEIVKERINDIVDIGISGKTEEDYNEYLKKRGVSC